MTSAPARPRRRARGNRGFSLVEVMVAFAILAVTVSALVIAEGRSVRLAEQALEARDTSVMADTVFRRVVYESDLWHEGDVKTADIVYAEYIGLKGTARDRWSNYKLVIHKRRGMVVGSDPSGHLDSLFAVGTSGESGSDSIGSGTSSPETSAAGEQAWLVWMDVFVGDETTTPVHTVRSIVPLQPGEEEEGK